MADQQAVDAVRQLDAAQFEAYLRRELAALTLVPAATQGAWRRSRRRKQLEAALAWLRAEPAPRRTYAQHSATRVGFLVGAGNAAIELAFDGFPAPGGWLRAAALVGVQLAFFYCLFYVVADSEWRRWRRRTLESYAEAARDLGVASNGPAN